jgi:hypothetical protein
MSDETDASQDRKAELYFKLAERAWARYESRRAIEWKTAIGLWSAFGAGAAVVLSARTWAPGWEEVILGLILASVVVYGYWHSWLPYLNAEMQRDAKASYFWETGLEILAGTRRPDCLLPPASTTDPATAWPRMDDPTGTAVPKLSSDLHSVLRVELAVSVLFALLFVGALASKAARRPASTGSKSSITIEGEDVTIESLSGLKAGTQCAPDKEKP